MHSHIPADRICSLLRCHGHAGRSPGCWPSRPKRHDKAKHHVSDRRAAAEALTLRRGLAGVQSEGQLVRRHELPYPQLNGAPPDDVLVP